MKRHLWEVSRTVLPHRHVFDFNQALMDFGATLCSARKPQCRRCVHASAVGVEHFGDRLLSVGLHQVLDVDVALTVGEGPLVRRLWADEPEHHRVQVEEFVGRRLVPQDLRPLRRPGHLLHPHRQPLGQPVRALVVGLR